MSFTICDLCTNPGECLATDGCEYDDSTQADSLATKLAAAEAKLATAEAERDEARTKLRHEAIEGDKWYGRARKWKRTAKHLHIESRARLSNWNECLDAMDDLREKYRIRIEAQVATDEKLGAVEKAGEGLRWVVNAMLDEFTGVPFANYHRARAAIAAWAALKAKESA